MQSDTSAVNFSGIALWDPEMNPSSRLPRALSCQDGGAFEPPSAGHGRGCSHDGSGASRWSPPPMESRTLGLSLLSPLPPGTSATTPRPSLGNLDLPMGKGGVKK